MKINIRAAITAMLEYPVEREKSERPKINPIRPRELIAKANTRQNSRK